LVVVFFLLAFGLHGDSVDNEILAGELPLHLFAFVVNGYLLLVEVVDIVGALDLFPTWLHYCQNV
jgi:hypothetical protein